MVNVVGRPQIRFRVLKEPVQVVQWSGDAFLLLWPEYAGLKWWIGTESDLQSNPLMRSRFIAQKYAA